MSASTSRSQPSPFLLAANEWTPLETELQSELRERQWRRWLAVARPEQLPPEGEWRTWYCRGGRGSGKTRAGAETFAHWILSSPPGDWAIVAPIYRSARDVCIEGPRSGLLAVLGEAVQSWSRSAGELWLKNGSKVHIDAAIDGAPRIQGYNLRGAWCDEVGLWYGWERAWHESLAPAVRLAPAKIICTGTPKGRRGLPKVLLDDPSIASTRLRTRDNVSNLDQFAIADLERRYGGSQLGRQELEGELIEDVDGALWTLHGIEETRVSEAPDLQRVVIGVDPSGGGASEVGIVAAGIADDGQGYVLRDASLRASPERWGAAVIGLYHDLSADRIIGEGNYGGDMVESVIRMADPNVSYKKVTASRGKLVRAEPVAALYEQARVHHVGIHEQLEAQMASYVPGDPSPDRMDALVWALTELMVQGRRPTPDVGPVGVGGQSSWRH